MARRLPESPDALARANEFIGGIARCADEAEVVDLTLTIVHYFAMQVFAFAIMVRAEGAEHYRYLVGCDLRLCFRYLQNKWHAIDPFVNYAMHNTSPILASDLPNISEGQRRMRMDAMEHGFRDGIAIPAHGSSSSIGMLYLGTKDGSEQAKRSLNLHRSLMRALAMELLEWWNTRRRILGMVDFKLDRLDVELLHQACEQATMQEAADSLGVTLHCAKKRYERLYKKLGVPSREYAVNRAIALGLIEPAISH